MYFVVATLLFTLLAKHSSAAIPCKVFVNKGLYPFIIATLHHTIPKLLASQLLFSLFNTRHKMSHIGDTIPTRLSMNKLTTEYWISYTN